jgi:hypothetical protein
VRPELFAILAALAVGCGPPPGERPLRLGPLDEFERSVEPILQSRCGQGGCHGRPDRPFAVYAPGVYRLDPARTHIAERLSAEEIERNAERLAALAVAPAEDSLALTKPLAVSAGGVHHGGGDVFVGDSDPDYRLMLRWLRACLPPPGDGGVP